MRGASDHCGAELSCHGAAGVTVAEGDGEGEEGRGDVGCDF